MNKLESIVIVKGNRGYKASVRFNNRFLDADIAHVKRYALDFLIERYLVKVLGKAAIY